MIKKISILAAMVLLASSAAYAASGTTNDCALAPATTGLSLYGAKTGVASATTPLIGKSSTGVCVGIITDAAGYGLLTQHINGTKAFGTTFDSTAIISADVTTKGTALLAKPTSSSISGFTGTWSSM